MKSPYTGKPVTQWPAISERLQRKFALTPEQLCEIVFQAWKSIFKSRIGRHGHRIGRDIFPQPQMIGFLLHELIPIELEECFPSQWRRGNADNEKDAVCIDDMAMSFEIKTSSSLSGIYGNRSYAQEGSAKKKARQGYFLAVNFDKFDGGKTLPEVKLIRFGWLDQSDWIGQKAQTGQQARLTPEARAYKLLRIWSRK